MINFILFAGYFKTMGVITLTVNDDIEKNVREQIVKVSRRGGKKGDLKKVVNAGLSMWLAWALEHPGKLTPDEP